MGLIIPCVLAIFVPINVGFTGGSLDDVFWNLMGCFVAGVVLCLTSVVIGLLLRTIVTVVRQFK